MHPNCCILYASLALKNEIDRAREQADEGVSFRCCDKYSRDFELEYLTHPMPSAAELKHPSFRLCLLRTSSNPSLLFRAEQLTTRVSQQLWSRWRKPSIAARIRKLPKAACDVVSNLVRLPPDPHAQGPPRWKCQKQGRRVFSIR